MYFTIALVTIGCAVIHTVNAQIIVTPTCSCVGRNQCYQNSTSPTGNDGSGVIDIRIVNPGDITTAPPVPQGTISPGVCAAGLDLCCGGLGCGLRYNISLTANTMPGPGQMRYGAQPWQVIIFGTDGMMIGGGTILDGNNILTAAHKVINRTATNIKVRAGEWDLTRTTEPYPMQEVLVAQIRIHPSYNNVTNPNLQNDVAILRLAQPILFNAPSINSICLPLQSQVFDNQRCIVSGWGKDSFTGLPQNIPKEVEVPVVPYADCQTRLRATRLGQSFNLDQNSFLCAGGEAGRDACIGDGGFALACLVNGRYTVAGLVAWGIGCADSNVPGVYVKVQNFLPWIQQQLAS